MKAFRLALCAAAAVGTFAGALCPSTVHAETVKIAWIDPLSGLMGALGQNQLRSWQYAADLANHCLLYTSPSPRDKRQSRMPSSA